MTSSPVADWTPQIAGRAGPVYRRIAASLHDAVITGKLAPGTRLPTHRDLAWRLGVTVGTVTRAYQEAERQGLIGGEVGRGTFVQDPRQTPPAPPFEPETGGNQIDLSVNATALWPDAGALRAAVAAVAERGDLASLMGYMPAHGVERLRRTAAAWIAATAGLVVPDHRVLTGAGGQGAMHAAFAALTRPGDVLLVEHLTYPGVKPLAAQLGLRLVPVPMDQHGILPDAVESLAAQHGAHVLYCMPTLQNPTTITLSPDRRQALVAVARRIGLTIVEDDVYGFLMERPPTTLAEIGPDVTVYVTSVSKSLFPGLRTGFIIPPEHLLDRVAAMLRAVMLTTSHLGAVTTAELIDSGEGARIVARRRAVVAERQRLAQARLGPFLTASDRAVTHLWLPLPEPWRREAFARELLDRGIKVTPADAFTVARGDTPHAVRVCLCSVDREDVLDGALKVVADLLHQPVPAESALV